MNKEIIVNAGELESRVAILENGRLMELHVEREPKIVGNIYKGRVTKVLKGMDAAFVDIGIERNAFLAASDVVPETHDENANGHGRLHRANIPPINKLLHANQELLVQVVRAPMGTKGARVTTRLSIPGRYMVLMLNSGSYSGVSRKIEDHQERTRLRAIANEIRPENYSLIVRTEAEGKNDKELRGDVAFLNDMAHRIEAKAKSSPSPSLIHGDLTLIFRLIRDTFTRDVNRLVVDSPATYENVLELIGMIAPRMKNRVFLYDEGTPIFHTYNIEPEIERTLRRKVWLPSGGTLVVDQAEALTAIDVNTGRFVGSVELAETVLTTNLQAADEVARQLRLRDLGGIIVVDFIDMDNPKHRQQVYSAFEDALKRDRAKIKVHNISPLGLVEMTRKRTGESLSRLLTEPCPFCSGIGRVQTPLTMALRIERELAATAAQRPETEAYLIKAHPRVIAAMMGYEGEAHRDLEDYLERPVYLRAEEDFHPNTYNLDSLTLEQALIAVKRIEENEVVEGQVVNPDPEVSFSPLVEANGIFIIVPDLNAPVGARVKLRVTETGTSLAFAEPVSAELRGVPAEFPVHMQQPPLVPLSVLPAYLVDESAGIPPRGLKLLSPTALSTPTLLLIEETEEEIAAPVEEPGGRKRKNGRNRKRGKEVAELVEEAPAAMEIELEALAPVSEEIIPQAEVAPAEEEPVPGTSRRRRRRRGGRGRGARQEEAAVSSEAIEIAPTEEIPEVAVLPQEEPTAAEVAPVAQTRRKRGGRRRRAAEASAVLPETIAPAPAPILEEISAETAAEVMLGLLQSIPGETEEKPSEEQTPAKPRRSARRRNRAKKEAAAVEVIDTSPALKEPVDVKPLMEFSLLNEEPLEPSPEPSAKRKLAPRKRTRKPKEAKTEGTLPLEK